MTQYILNNWSASVFGSLFFLGFLLAKPLLSHRISKNVQYWMLLLILFRFLWCAPVTISWGNPTPVMTYKNELTSQIQKPVENIQQTFTTPKTENLPSFQQEAEAITSTVIQSPSFSFQRQWLLAALPLVSVGIFLYHCVGYFRFCRLLRHTFQTPSPLATQVFDAIRQQLHISKHVRLVETSVLSAPLCIGVFRPTIVIPTGTHTEKELRPILYHELTHQKHKDVWVKWLTLVAVSLHFFNPLVYWLRKELNLYGELRCDERVIASMERDEKQYYGQLLIQMATQPQSVVGGGFAAMSEEKQSLKERLVAIMKYKKKSRWIQVFSIAVVGMAALCLAFSGMTFANDADAFQAQFEKAKTIRNQSKWANFPNQLKAAELLPTSLVERCTDTIDSPYTDHMSWEDGHGTGLMILLKLRGDELLNYEYRNGGGTKVVEEIHPIDTTQAVEKSLDFLKTYHIGTPELTDKLAKGMVNQNQMTLQPVDTKNPNYHVTKITMNLGEKDQYAFTVDLNMGGIIGFDNLYEQQLAERDVVLWYHTIRNGQDYVDQVQPGQVYLWTNEKGGVWDVNFPNNFSVTEPFDNKEALMTALKNANHEKDFPAQLDFKQASVEYYLTPDNVDYRHPTKTTKVEEDVYFKVYDLKGDYTKNIKRISVWAEDAKDGVGYNYLLVNDDTNFYHNDDPTFRLMPMPLTMKSIDTDMTTTTETSSGASDPDYQPPVETVTPLQHSSFKGAVLQETAYADGKVNYSVDAIKRIPPVQCYDRFYESNSPKTEMFTGVEVFYFGDGKAAKEKMMEWFQSR